MLSVGDVFWLVNPAFPQAPRHPHIVIAITPDKRVFYVYTTSQKDTVERFCLKAEGKSDPKHLKTMVEVDQSECAVLTNISYINANLSYDKDEYSLTKLQTFNLCKDVKASQPLLNRITIALLSSVTIKPILRSMLIASLTSPQP